MIKTDIRKSPLIAFSLAASMLLGGCMGEETPDTTANDGAAVTTTSTSDNTTQPPANTADGNGTQTTDNGGITTQPAAVGTAVLYWQAPSTNTDGSALVDLQGYKVYMGSSASDLKYVASVGATTTSYTVNSLNAGAYYFAVSAYNQAGAESAFSNVASKTLTN